MENWYTEGVRERAFQIWETEGHLHGHDTDHWFRAEAEFKSSWAQITTTQHSLWSGVDRKLQSAAYFLERMYQSLERPRGSRAAVLEASGEVVDTQWQRAFYPNLDGFLVAIRSVPDIAQFCFG